MRARIWTFLNSSLGVWFLSSIVLSGLSVAYTHLQSKRTEERQSRALQRKLDTEIGHRIFNTQTGLAVNRENVSRGANPGTTRGAYALVALYLNNQLQGVDYSVFTEYRTRTFPSLLIELSTLVDPVDAVELKGAIETYTRIAMASSDARGDRPDTPPQAIATIDEIDALIRKELAKPRWAIALLRPR